MKTSHKVMKAVGSLCILAAIVDVGVGIHSVEKHNAVARTYWDRETLYDGPWLPIEFGLLVVGFSLIKCDEEALPVPTK
jgi:hypothetical protein